MTDVPIGAHPQRWTQTTHCIDPATFTIDELPDGRPTNAITVAPGVRVTTSAAIQADDDDLARLDAFEQIALAILREVDSWRARLALGEAAAS